jgi:hypothetical protein
MTEFEYDGRGLGCDHHDAWDEDGEPVGGDCGQPVTHIIVWHDSQQRSASCANHHSDEHFQGAPAHTVFDVASVPDMPSS